jgi:SAM-dependent methyltransferase
MHEFTHETVTVPCLVCGSASHTPLLWFRGFRIARCLGCGFVFVNPRPTQASLLQLYTNPDENPFFAETYEELQYEAAVLLKVVQTIQTHVRGGELLEVGCGRGDLLRIAQARGFSVTGCDFFGDKAPELPGASFHEGTLGEATFPEHAFDVVVVRNMLEHVFDPNREIAEIRRVLQPHGYLYLKVPNIRFEYGLGCRLVFGKRHAFEAPYHLNHFAPKTLTRFLHRAGFEVVAWSLEQPTPSPRWGVNVARQAGYRAIRGIARLTGGRMFPRILLCCLARKKESACA